MRYCGRFGLEWVVHVAHDRGGESSLGKAYPIRDISARPSGSAQSGPVGRREMMRVSRIGLLALAAAASVLAIGVGGATSATTTTIDFETLTGPSTFCAPAQPPLTMGVATFSGGVIMTAVTNLPANQTTVYGTFDCPGYSPTISIAFSTPVSNLSLQVMNGETSTVSYTVASDLGGTVTKSLVANFSSGADTFALPDDGITSVTIARTTPSSVWDFFIDNISFVAFPITTAECKNGGWQAYGVFKNQGDCVSWVATNGRNEPAG
jgi:hypothetical protein